MPASQSSSPPPRLGAPWTGAARYGLLCAAVVVGALLSGLAPVQGSGGLVAVPDGWSWRWGAVDDATPLDDAWDDPRWTPVTLPARVRDGAGAGEHVLWMRGRVPVPDGMAEATLAFDAVHGPFEIYVDGARVAQHPRDVGLAARAPPGSPWVLVGLPPRSDGGAVHDVVMRVRAAGWGAAIRGTPLVGGKSDLLAWVIGRDAPRLAVGATIALLVLLGLVVYARREDARLHVGYALWGVSAGLYVVLYTHIKDIVVDAPRFWFGAWIVSLPLIPVGMLLLVDALFGPDRWLRRLLAAHVAVAGALYVFHVVALAAYAQGPAAERMATGAFHPALNVFRLLFFISAVAITVVVARVASSAGERREDARIYLIGFLVDLAFTVRDILAALGAAPYSWKSGIHIGVLTMTCALAVIVARRSTRVHERVAVLAHTALLQAREKERLLRDLHDGVGTLTSNVRLLAQLGQKNGDAAGALSGIAELSSAALAELRSYVHALDDATMTWRALVAELRRYAATVVEKSGFALDVDAEIAPDVADAKPPGLLTLHVVRVFRELLTNALKQERVTRVGVALTVAPDRFELVVDNDGGAARRAGDGAGIGASRGLANLRARAAEVGGTLEAVVGDDAGRTVVALRVPLPMKPPTGAADPHGAAGVESAS